MKPHEPKNRYKTRAENKGKTKGDKKPNKKMRKDNKTLSQKKEKVGGKKTWQKAIKEGTKDQGSGT
jgi:hypothetical protein